jgi:hypothetical protein
MYFAEKSGRWNNKGAAFLETKPSDSSTLGRGYLVTFDQFGDIACQENSRDDKLRFGPTQRQTITQNRIAYLNARDPLDPHSIAKWSGAF